MEQAGTRRFGHDAGVRRWTGFAMTMVMLVTMNALPPVARAAQARIVNGLNTHDYPTTGALLYSQSGQIDEDNAGAWCSGTLIGCQTFLTAAHCVSGDTTPGAYWVYLQHAGIFGVTSITKHPSYTDSTFPIADVAVLKLGGRVDGIHPTAVNQIDPAPAIPTSGTIVGFGQTSGAGQGARDYGIKRAGTVETSSCPSGLPAGATDTEVICWTFSAPVGAPGEDSNTCNGDSGGPLLLDLGAGEVVAGITSGGLDQSCQATDTGYDANVFTYRNFILDELGADPTSTCGGMPPVGDPMVNVIARSGVLDGSNLSDAFTISLGGEVTALRFGLNGEDNGNFDVNMYVKEGAGASPGDFDCKADGNGVFGACEVLSPNAGDWSVFIERSLGSGEYQLTATIFTRDAPVCGNERVEAGEQCDGTDDAACPGTCGQDCVCQDPCGVGDLFSIRAWSAATPFGFRALLDNVSGTFDAVDPRDGFSLVLTQGVNRVTAAIPPGSIEWARSRPERGRYLWRGDLGGIRRVRAIDKSATLGIWRIGVRGRLVPGASAIDTRQTFDVRLTLDGTCTEATSSR